MVKNWTAFLLLPVLAAALFSGCRSAQEETVTLPYLPGNEYSLYLFSDVFPHPVSGGAPAVLDGAKRRTVTLSQETLQIPGVFRQSRSRSAVLVNEFESPAKGEMTFGCDADRFLKVECNGQVVLDRWQENRSSGTISKYNNILTVPVRQGRNVLVFTVANGSDGWSFTAGSIPDALRATEENLECLCGFLPAPTSRAHRADALLMDHAVRKTDPAAFLAFEADPTLAGEKLTAAYMQNPLLRVYDLALDRILDELPAAKPAPGTIVVWNLCKTGIVVKTAESAFGIDLDHRRAELLAPHLDALFLTGADRGSLPLMRAMSRAGKPVFSTFFHGGRTLHTPAAFRVRDLRVHAVSSAPLPPGKQPVTVYRIICGRDSGAPVLLHAGKSCRPDLLRSIAPADLLVVSTAAGSQLPDAAHSLSSGLTILSGLWEIGGKGGVPAFSTDAETVRGEMKQEGCRAVVLLWGEKIRLSGEALRRHPAAANMLRYENALKTPFVLSGLPWRKAGEPLSRLPLFLTEKELSPETLAEARQTSGAVIRFRTDSSEIALRALCSGGENCAIDLYEEPDAANGSRSRAAGDRLCGTLRTVAGNEKSAFLQGTLFRSKTGQMRSFAVYLPSACCVRRLEIGLREKSKLLSPLPHAVKKPVVFCGGNATQGGSASHPANSFSSILCRTLDAEQINLGFRNAPQASPAVANLIAALDPAAVVLEYDGRLPRDAQERFFRTIRSARPDLPVLLLGECTQIHPDSAAAVRTIYENALARGDRRVRLIEGKELFSPYSPEDCCVDRVSPSDLGFRLMSRRILPILRSYLFFPGTGK